MKKNPLVYIALVTGFICMAGTSLTTANAAGIERVSNISLLSPAAFHPDLNKLHNDYPYGLPKQSDDYHEQAASHHKEGSDNNAASPTENDTTFQVIR
ncbi:hypothetical protein CWS43_15585 [Rahnella sp. AA]|uniref:hypothetical protein n=1 Tax=Rahnella sp. AA TaxID=2057180 RepID=UPI000C338BBC|nr:hypothetical protein [Rahnella sp. AA]PKE29470.1 hypothetical protein CWS43_15585 [Rahnella sp. AA]